MPAAIPPPFGVYTPLVTYFDNSEAVDIESTKQHALRMVQGGVTGLVLQGSNGEAPHLLHDERQYLVRQLRDFLTSNGYTNITLIVGCGAPSVRETLLYIAEAKEAGADYALILPPSYWVAAMSVPVVENFYTEVARDSALPFLIYNFPGVTGGLNISSDTITKLAKANPNLVGVKLTCGNLGTLQRVASSLPKGTFAPFAGKSDFFLPGLVAGSNGVIAALANIAPKTHVKLLDLYRSGDLAQAIELQSKLSHADFALQKVGVAGVKAIVKQYFGYGTGRGRRPLGTLEATSLSKDVLDSLEVVISLEKEL